MAGRNFSCKSQILLVHQQRQLGLELLVAYKRAGFAIRSCEPLLHRIATKPPTNPFVGHCHREGSATGSNVAGEHSQLRDAWKRR